MTLHDGAYRDLVPFGDTADFREDLDRHHLRCLKNGEPRLWRCLTHHLHRDISLPPLTDGPDVLIGAANPQESINLFRAQETLLAPLTCEGGDEFVIRSLLYRREKAHRRIITLIVAEIDATTMEGDVLMGIVTCSILHTGVIGTLHDLVIEDHIPRTETHPVRRMVGAGARTDTDRSACAGAACIADVLDAQGSLNEIPVTEVSARASCEVVRTHNLACSVAMYDGDLMIVEITNDVGEPERCAYTTDDLVPLDVSQWNRRHSHPHLNRDW